MRIIAGHFKGRRLKTLKGMALRPTSDKLRETLFNVLAPRIEGARVLDGFAGTGAIGLEALSRGAAHVTFVERNLGAATLIEENAAMCTVAGRYTIARGDFVTLVPHLGRDGAFDLVLLDPPYDIANVRDVLDAAGRVLAEGGLVVLERAARHEPEVPPTLQRVRDLRSGDSALSVFTRRNENPRAH